MATAADLTISDQYIQETSPRRDPDHYYTERVGGGGGGGNNAPGYPVILNIDGTVAESGGSAFGVSDFGAWTGGENVTVVTDNNSPTGNNSAINFQWNNTGGFPDSAIATASTLGSATNGYNKLYIRFSFRLVDSGGGEWNFGHKFFYFGLHNDGNAPTELYTGRAGGASPGRMRLTNQSGSGDNIPIDTFLDAASEPVVIGQVHTCEFLIDRLAGTGKYWQDGNLIVDKTGVTWPSTPFNGLEWYGNTSDTISVTSHMRLYELYIEGEAA